MVTYFLQKSVTNLLRLKSINGVVCLTFAIHVIVVLDDIFKKLCLQCKKNNWWKNEWWFQRCGILIIDWFGAALLMWEDYTHTSYHGFKTICCLITVDGSDDSKINPRGFDRLTMLCYFFYCSLCPFQKHRRTRTPVWKATTLYA